MNSVDVSIIVPVHNGSQTIGPLLASLEALESLQRAELIIADNNSTDNTVEIINRASDQLPGLQIVHEAAIQNPDAARNRALGQASGIYCAFTDSDCLPDPLWLQQGVRLLKANQADLVAGKIEFKHGLNPSCAEYYDSVSFLQHDTSVTKRSIAFTANLFVRRSVLEEIGRFPVVPGWSGDTVFVRQAVSRGYRLVYEDSAIVRHKPRNFEELLSKFRRIGEGKGASAFDALFRRQGRTSALSLTSLRISGSAQHFENLNPVVLARRLRQSGNDLSLWRSMSVWALGVFMMTYCGIVFAGKFLDLTIKFAFSKRS